MPIPLIPIKLVIKRSPADAQFGGGGGAVAVVTLQRCQDVLALDFLKRSPGIGIPVLSADGPVVTAASSAGS